MPSTPTGYGNGTMYAQANGTVNTFRQAASHGYMVVAPSNVNTEQPGSPGAAAVFFGWKALTWCKNIMTIMFPFFDKSLSTPYSGQLFPTGTSVGGSGQVFPTRG